MTMTTHDGALGDIDPAQMDFARFQTAVLSLADAGADDLAIRSGEPMRVLAEGRTQVVTRPWAHADVLRILAGLYGAAHEVHDRQSIEFGHSIAHPGGGARMMRVAAMAVGKGPGAGLEISLRPLPRHA